MAENHTAEKSCFVVCPIGERDSAERLWSDDILEHLIQPIATEFGYSARRAIDQSLPGEITGQVIKDVINADLVIADLTFHNANVFYELAIRHAQGKPFFHIAAQGTKIPFDIATINTVFVDGSTFASADRTKSQLRTYFEALRDDKASFDNLGQAIPAKTSCGSNRRPG